MVLEFIINAIKKFVMWIISMFPTLPSFDWLFDLINPIFDILKFVCLFVDLPLYSSCLLLIIAFNNIEKIWALVAFIIHKFGVM